MRTDLDLSPLADLQLRLMLERGRDYAGLHKLGLGMKISYR